MSIRKGRGRMWRLISLLSAFALVVAACGGDDDAADAGGPCTSSGGDGALKVAFVHIGPTEDKGWTWAHNNGCEFMVNELGDQVKVTTLVNIPEDTSSQAVFEQLAEDGNKLIFATSFNYMDPMLAAAESYPDTVFMHATGFKVSDNMGNYFGAAEEGRYLSGMAAGAATDSNLIGYVAAFPIPEVLRGINAFTLSAREVNPAAEVRVIWTSTWFDPATEKTAAESLLDAGADVIAMHQDSPAAGEAAEAADGKWVGYNTDMTEFAPDAWLTAAVWDWGPFYLKTTQDVISNSWASGFIYGNMADGMVGLAPFGDSVDSATKDVIAARQAEIIAGTFSVLPDPIVDQSGASRELGDIFIMDFLVEGVIGDIPAG